MAHAGHGSWRPMNVVQGLWVWCKVRGKPYCSILHIMGKINLTVVTQSGTVGHLEYCIFQEGCITRRNVIFKREGLASFSLMDIDWFASSNDSPSLPFYSWRSDLWPNLKTQFRHAGRDLLLLQLKYTVMSGPDVQMVYSYYFTLLPCWR